MPGDVIVSDANQDTLEKLKADYPRIRTTTENTEVAEQNLVFLGLHPPVLAEALVGIKDSVKPDTAKFAPDNAAKALREMVQAGRKVGLAQSLAQAG